MTLTEKAVIQLNSKALFVDYTVYQQRIKRLHDRLLNARKKPYKPRQQRCKYFYWCDKCKSLVVVQ